MKSLSILITGSRTWDDYNTLKQKILEVISDFVSEHPELRTVPLSQWLTIIHGNCSRGADRLADIFAVKVLQCKVKRYDAQWNVYGKRAGRMRNLTMVSTMPDVCLAFIRDKSPGATHCYNTAKSKGINSERFVYDPEKVNNGSVET